MASDFFSIDAKASHLASLVAVYFLKLSTHRGGVARISGERNGLPMIPIGRRVTQDMQGLYDRKRDRVAEPRSRAHCRYRSQRRVGQLETGLVLPFASNQASKISRDQRRDRLLNDDECEAA